MFYNALYLLLALFGVGFLIFIHELGHYIMALRVGMRVEVFSIGMGKPFFTWTFQNVKWQLCYLPFGGYVKIAGDKEGECDKAGEDTYYGKKPVDRIKVALAGPIVNIAFAFLIFTAIWLCKGQVKNFSEFTNLIGYVDTNSALYKNGVKPGDQVIKYNNQEVTSFKTLLYNSVLNQENVHVQGERVNYYTGQKASFDLNLPLYETPLMRMKGLKTVGILAPARCLYYEKGAKEMKGPMENSGIAQGDRIIWANGEMIFSLEQLSSLLNDKTVMLTVKRGGTQFLAKVLRMPVSDLRISEQQMLELEDWQHEAGIKGGLQKLFYIPYNMNAEAVIEENLNFVGNGSKEYSVYDVEDSTLVTEHLRKGDQILAVDGIPVTTSLDLIKAVQEKHVKMIVQRKAVENLSSKNENSFLMDLVSPKELTLAVQSIIMNSSAKAFGDLVVLNPVTPAKLLDLPFDNETRESIHQSYVQALANIQKMPDENKKQEAEKQLESQMQKLVLGISLSDLKVRYNPNPFSMTLETIKDTGRTLGSLLTGKLNPKWMSGPIGMVQAIHYGWSQGIKDGLHWIAIISLNLGIFNLLPLPVLDGGHICFSLYEFVTRRRLSPKVMEKLIVPFVVLLIGLFVFVTYQDIIRLLARFI